MATNPNAPADTNMMRIVHNALRRDLGRARAALRHQPPPDEHQLAAIAEHLGWMMRFLEAHHRSEDAGLYPLVRQRDPSTTALLDEMARDHEAVSPAVRHLEEAASSTDPDRCGSMVAAIDHLNEVLLPHLEREEREVMPIVSRVITNAQWQAVEQAHNLDGKSMRQLGREGHWLIDDATPQDRARVLGLVPWFPRQALVYGFGPSYRRRRRACWSPRRRVQQEGQTAVVVDADIESVWEVVRDPTRVGEWSHECVSAEWLGPITEAVPGARFRGRNKQGMFRWGRQCEVLRVAPFEIVWRTVPTSLYPDSTEWAIRLSQHGDGTRIVQSFQVVKGSKLEPLYATVVPAHRDRTDKLRHDLQRVGQVANRTRPTDEGASSPTDGQTSRLGS